MNTISILRGLDACGLTVNVGYVGKGNVAVYQALAGVLHVLVEDTFAAYCGRTVVYRTRLSETLDIERWVKGELVKGPILCRRCLSRIEGRPH